MTLKISCLITSYNNGPWIRRSIESVVNQTYPVSEIIVADDASTDDSRDIVRSLSTIYPGIRVILREKNVGVAANRDLAIREAQGDFITTLDGDDFYYPDKIEKEANAMARLGPECIAYSNFDRIDVSEKVYERVQLANFCSLSKEKIISYFLLRAGVLPRDLLFAKALFLKVGGYRHSLKMYEDWDIKLRLARDAARWVQSGTIGVAHRHHGAGLSDLDSLTHLQHMLDVIYSNRPWLEPMLGVNSIKNALARVIQSRLA